MQALQSKGGSAGAMQLLAMMGSASREREALIATHEHAVAEHDAVVRCLEEQLRVSRRQHGDLLPPSAAQLQSIC